MKRQICIVALGILLVTACASGARRPAQNISAERHPNLAEAQRLSRQAYDKIVEAQRVNEWDLGGHAERAKQLLEQVNAELKQAAEVSNEHRGK